MEIVSQISGIISNMELSNSEILLVVIMAFVLLGVIVIMLCIYFRCTCKGESKTTFTEHESHAEAHPDSVNVTHVPGLSVEYSSAWGV